jgi:hypothetical protein
MTRRQHGQMQNFGVPYREAGADLECMARIYLQQGSAEYYAFALELYLSTMRPYTEELMVWDEQRQRMSRRGRRSALRQASTGQQNCRVAGGREK